MSFKTLLISCILIALFSFALISFAFQSQSDNGINNLRNDPTLNLTYIALNNTLNNAALNSKTQLNATSTDDVTMGVGGLLYLSIVGVTRTFTGTITGTFVVFTAIFARYGISPIITTTIMSIIIISIIFLVWRNVRTGD